MTISGKNGARLSAFIDSTLSTPPESEALPRGLGISLLGVSLDRLWVDLILKRMKDDFREVNRPDKPTPLSPAAVSAPPLSFRINDFICQDTNKTNLQLGTAATESR